MARLHPVGFEADCPACPTCCLSARSDPERPRRRDRRSVPFPVRAVSDDLHLLGEGTHYRAYDKLGAHPGVVDGVAGVAFAVWAPNARRVSVVGDFNDWDGRRHPMRLHPGNGIWEIFVPGWRQARVTSSRSTAAPRSRSP